MGRRPRDGGDVVSDVLHIAAVFGAFVAIIVGAGLVIGGIAFVYALLVEEESPLWLDPTDDTDPVRVLPRIDFHLDEEP